MRHVFLLAALITLLSGSAAAQNPGAQPGQMPQPTPFQPPQPGVGARTSNALTQVQGFNIVLLVGESQSSGASIDDVPPAARKALNDMRDFLPFKHYRVIDSQWTSCCADSPSVQIRGQVQGAYAYGPGPEIKIGTKPYEFSLHVSPASAQRLSVMFSLGEPRTASQNTGSYAGSREELERRHAELRKELDSLDDEIPRRLARVGEKHPEVVVLQQQRLRVQQRLAESVNSLAAATEHRQQGARRSLIDSSFTMELGETVVVGTSRLGGDKALIAIVTAVKRGSPAR